MKYKTHITEMEGKYIGFVFLENEPVYKSNEHTDPILVTRELSQYLSANPLPTPRFSRPSSPSVNGTSQAFASSKVVPVTNGTSSAPPVQESTKSVYTPVITSPNRRCCGRG